MRGLHRVLHAAIYGHPEFIEDIVVLANFIFEHLLPARIHLREIRLPNPKVADLVLQPLIEPPLHLLLEIDEGGFELLRALPHVIFELFHVFISRRAGLLVLEVI